MATSFKAERMAKHLREALLLRLGSAWACDEALDTNSNPLLTLRKTADGGWTAAEEYIVIRIKPIDPVASVDTYGLTVQTHTPHVVQVISEASAVAGVGVVKDATMAKVLADVFLLGSKVETFLSANTVQPVYTLMVAAQLTAEIYPEPRHTILAMQ